MPDLSVTLKPIYNHGPECGCWLHDAETRGDPTGTTTIRKRFEAEAARRFRRLRALIVKSIVEHDALGLGKFGPPENDNQIIRVVRDQALDPGQFAFTRAPDKVEGFMAWLRQQQQEQILGVQPGTPMVRAAEQAWASTYITAAYQKGIRDAGQKLRKAGADVAPSFVEQAFTRPIHADRVGLAYTRAFSELQGITETMDQQISRILAQGIAEGQNPAQIARNISNRVNNIGIHRARVMARTETIATHAEATLNGFEEAGIEGVEVEAEFATAGDARVCPQCEALEGNVYPMDRARGIIPVHPNCRCAFIPVVQDGTGIELR